MDEEAKVTREKPEVKKKPRRRTVGPPLLQAVGGGTVRELGK